MWTFSFLSFFLPFSWAPARGIHFCCLPHLRCGRWSLTRHLPTFFFFFCFEEIVAPPLGHLSLRPAAPPSSPHTVFADFCAILCTRVCSKTTRLQTMSLLKLGEPFRSAGIGRPFFCLEPFCVFGLNFSSLRLFHGPSSLPVCTDAPVFFFLAFFDSLQLPMRLIHGWPSVPLDHPLLRPCFFRRVRPATADWCIFFPLARAAIVYSGASVLVSSFPS